MKLKKTTYFSLFFLFCFLASFSLSSYQNFRTKITTKITPHSKAVALSAKDFTTTNNDDLLFEEDEKNEKENTFHAQALILPFLASFFQSLALKPENALPSSLGIKLINPIYISVCNFRI